MTRLPVRALAIAGLLMTSLAAHAERYTVPLFLAPGTSGDPQGVLRIVNDTGEAATVQVFAIADDGTRAGPATIALGASAAVQFDATELRSANAAKGLSGGLGSFPGDVRLSIDSDAPIVPLAFARASDGTLSAMHDTVRPALAEGEPYRYEIPVFNRSTEAQASRLRLINPGDTSAAVTIGGRDDSGALASGGAVTLALPAGGARTLTAQQLEAGGTGLTGRLGTGTGKWRLTVESDRPLQVVNVAVSAAGSWDNLSTVPAGAAPADALAFAGRFGGQGVVFESRSFTATAEFFADGRFAETLEYFTFVWQAGGSYDYVSTGPHAGRVTTERDDGDACAVDMYFASRSDGRFATHCAGGGADDLWFGGRWHVEGEEDDGGPAQTTYGVNDALPGVPTSGLFAPADVSGGSARASGGSTTIDLNDSGYFDLNDGTRYTCAAAGGCEIVDGTVTRGSVTGRTAGSGDVDRFPGFRSATAPDNQTYAVGTVIDTLTLPAAAGGNPPLTYSLSPGVPGLSFDGATRRLGGTPTAAGSYAMAYTVTDADGDIDSLRFTIEVRDAESPDLAVGSVSVGVHSSPSTGAPFTLSATVQNRGDARSAATTLRYYRSSDATISRGDAAVGTDPVGALAASGASAESISLTFLPSAGTYYYGACVDSVPDESSTTNNCSAGVRVDVSSGGVGGTELSAPQIEVSGTQVTVIFRVSGQAGGPVAFEPAVRVGGGSWQSPTGCREATLNSGNSESEITWTPRLTATPPAGTVIEARYRQYDDGSCSGSPRPWSPTGSATVPGQGLGFIENGPVSRSIPENLPGGINVGIPVTAVGGGALTYSIGGVDADSFDIVPETGQLRTSEDVWYDFETKSRYEIEITVADDAGNRETIGVAIDVLDVTPKCYSSGDFGVRNSSGEGRITVWWKPLPNVAGHARVLGYQTEIKRGAAGPWTDRRTFYGQAITAATYANLDDGIEHHVRVRAVHAEGDCAWSIPVSGIPTGDFAPRDIGEMFDRFGPHPVGTDQRNIRLLTPGRCRHTANGVSLDAHCRYERMSPQAGRITLEFDDPSRGSCDATFAYSSLTAGSFLDECFGAGVNTQGFSFDRSFRMPRVGPAPPDTTPQRAPRSPDEFDEFVFGRGDFIPGLTFTAGAGSNIRPNLSIGPGSGLAIMRHTIPSPNSAAGRTWKDTIGRYSYINTGPSTGQVLFEAPSGRIYTFALDFEPDGNVRTTVTGPDTWPGLPHLDLILGAQTILLPLPPFWSAAIAIEAEHARVAERREEISRALSIRFFPDLFDLVKGDGGLNLSLPSGIRWEKDGDFNGPGFGAGRTEAVGRNRVVYVFGFPRRDPKKVYGDSEEETQRRQFLNGSEWTFVVTIKSDGGAEYFLTISKEGELPVILNGFIDPDGENIDLDEFPDELRLPDEPPQASGKDVAGVEVAAANSAPGIGPDDLQVLLASADGGDYRPGDWLEPKDGGNQRMMIVSAGQSGSVAASNRSLRFRSLNGPAPAAPAPQYFALSGGIAGNIKSNVGSAPYTLSGTGMNPTVQPGAAVSAATDAGILSLIVVCMQKGHDIPTRGARFFSATKSAEGPVQTCQKECVLNESTNIQRCVWACEQESE